MRVPIRDGWVTTMQPSIFGDVGWQIADHSYFGHIDPDRPTMHFKLSDWQTSGAAYPEALAKRSTLTSYKLVWPETGEVEVVRERDDINITVFDTAETKLFTVTFSATDDHVLADGQNRHAVGDQPLDFNAFRLAMQPFLETEAV